MIISRAPFRVSFCGGGSDIPAFYEKYGGCVLSCSIRKYVYIALHPSFNKQTITLKYSKTEEVNDFDEIQHKYFKIMLKDYNIKGVEIASMADVNFFIEKMENNGRTRTTIKKLNENEKIFEVARFLSGDKINELSISNARELVAEQNKYKQSLEKIDK